MKVLIPIFERLINALHIKDDRWDFLFPGGFN